MPVVAPIMKVENCKRYGAKVIIHGQNIGESREHALKISKSQGLMYINGYDHPNIIAGQGTMGLEICEQVPDVDAVIIPVGGGGLIAGCAVALKTMNPKIQVIVSIHLWTFFLRTWQVHHLREWNLKDVLVSYAPFVLANPFTLRPLRALLMG